jgi:hypothetical protein
MRHLYLSLSLPLFSLLSLFLFPLSSSLFLSLYRPHTLSSSPIVLSLSLFFFSLFSLYFSFLSPPLSFSLSIVPSLSLPLLYFSLYLSLFLSPSFSPHLSVSLTPLSLSISLFLSLLSLSYPIMHDATKPYSSGY